MKGIEKSVDVQLGLQVIKVLSEYFSADGREVEWDSSLVEDFYVDSINVVEIVMMLNETFRMELPEAVVAGWTTVADICFSVEKQQSEQYAK